MSLRRVMVLFLIPATPLLAQLANNTVTVTASQSSTVQPDEAVFSVVVTSGPDKSLDDAVAAISSIGITAANLAAVEHPESVDWRRLSDARRPTLVLDLSTDGSLFENQRHHFSASSVAEIHLAK